MFYVSDFFSFLNYSFQRGEKNQRFSSEAEAENFFLRALSEDKSLIFSKK